MFMNQLQKKASIEALSKKVEVYFEEELDREYSEKDEAFFKDLLEDMTYFQTRYEFKGEK